MRKSMIHFVILGSQSINFVQLFCRYFQEVLSSADTNEIQLNKDGSWSTHVIGNDAQSLDTPHKKYQSVDISDDTGKYLRALVQN